MQLWSDRSGAVLPIFAVMVLVVIGSVGLAVDYGRITSARNRMQAITDSATLAAAVSSQPATGDSQSDRHAAAVSTGQSFVASHGATAGVDGASFVLDVSAATVTGRFSGNVQLALMQVLTGYPSVPLTTTAVVNVAGPSYAEYHFVLDVSESMNIASTTTGIARLMAITKPYTDLSTDNGIRQEQGCAFACHIRHESGFEPPGQTMQSIAIANNIELRADVMRSAARSLSASILSGSQSRARIGVFQFSDSYRQVLSPTDSLDDVNRAIDDQAVQRVNTGLDTSLPLMTDVIGSSGSGASSTDPRKFAIIATDGAIGDRGMKRALPEAACDRLKANGVQVAVIYVKQFPLPTSGAYTSWVEPVLGDIEAALRRCASPGMFFQAQESDTIQAAFSSTGTTLTAPTVALAR